MISDGLKQQLTHHPDRVQLARHAFFNHLEQTRPTRQLAARFIGQWWHPLHYFPTFLARTIAVADSVAVKTATSRILFQELGEGEPPRAHENIYISTMHAAGFSREEITCAEALPATTALLKGYEKSSKAELTGIGFIYATEMSDLTMVRGLGIGVRRATGVAELPWVDIHMQQEPSHVQEAGNAISADFTAAQIEKITETAAQAWKLWIGFFDALYATTETTARAPIIKKKPRKTLALSIK